MILPFRAGIKVFGLHMSIQAKDFSITFAENVYLFLMMLKASFVAYGNRVKGSMYLASKRITIVEMLLAYVR